MFVDHPLIMNFDRESFLSTCASGGPGSSSCSMEAAGISCSVDCNEGYYSCCGTTGCKCFDEDGSSDPGEG